MLPAIFAYRKKESITGLVNDSSSQGQEVESQIMSNGDQIIVAWEVKDKENPYNWSRVSFLQSTSKRLTKHPPTGQEAVHSFDRSSSCP